MRSLQVIYNVCKELTNKRREFTRDRELNAHLLSDHNIIRKTYNTTGVWTCRYAKCGRKFESRSELWDHKRERQHINNLTF
jgi:hypothetical protein